jgi:hypothetical protein
MLAWTMTELKEAKSPGPVSPGPGCCSACCTAGTGRTSAKKREGKRQMDPIADILDLVAEGMQQDYVLDVDVDGDSETSIVVETTVGKYRVQVTPID